RPGAGPGLRRPQPRVREGGARGADRGGSRAAARAHRDPVADLVTSGRERPMKGSSAVPLRSARPVRRPARLVLAMLTLALGLAGCATEAPAVVPAPGVQPRECGRVT